jgi:pimeloyl-ACP methyl ester carboxylesterase
MAEHMNICSLLTRATGFRKGIAMVQHEYAQVNGIRLHYVTAGSGPLLLFLHGFPDFWYLWNNQIAHFSQSYRVVAPDLRGYNLSDKPVDVAHYRLPLIVEDIRALLDHLGQQPIILVGHDWGGVVAWEFAARYPAYLTKLIIFSTAPLDIIRRALRDPDQRREWMYQLIVTCPQAEQILRAGDHYLFNLTVFGANVEVPPDYFSAADRATYQAAWAQPGAITGASITTARRTCWITSARLIDSPFSTHGHTPTGTLPASAFSMACAQSMYLGMPRHPLPMSGMTMYRGRMC